jgi:hypothetical protein
MKALEKFSFKMANIKLKQDLDWNIDHWRKQYSGDGKW